LDAHSDGVVRSKQSEQLDGKVVDWLEQVRNEQYMG